MWLFNVFLILGGCVVISCTRNNTGESRLFNDIIWNNNPYERPRNNKSQSVMVEFDFNLRSVSHFDEAKQHLVFTGWFVMMWTDEFLTWDPSKYDGTGSINPPSSYIWKPDIVAANSFQQLDSLGGSFVSLMLTSSGHVEWKPSDLFSVPCNVDVQSYPFDKLVCFLELAVWSYTLQEVNLRPTRSLAGTDQLMETGQWSLIEPPSLVPNPDTVNNQTISRMVITLTLNRAPTNFIFSFILPVLMLSMLGTFVFLIPSDSGEKISFAITIPLSYGVYMGFLTTLVPQSSQGISIFLIFLGLTLSLAAVFVILSIYTVRISRRESTRIISPRYQRITFWVEKVKCCGRVHKITDLIMTSPDDRNTEDTTKTPPLTWMRVSKALDLLFFWIFSLPILIAIPAMIFYVCFE